MRRLRIVRIVLGLAVFVCLNLCFFGLVSGASVLFRFQLLPAVLALNVVAVVTVLALTALVGRVYCSVFCPMGVFQDLLIGLFRRLRGKRRARALPPPPRGVRWGFFAAAVVLIACGFVSLGALLDGYSLYGRLAAHVLKPAYSALLNAIAALQANAGHPFLIREEVFVRGLCSLVVALAGLVGLVALVAWRGRLFCNALCPVGAVLSLAARRPLLRLSIKADACVECGQCASVCPCGAIDLAAKRVDDAACVRCCDCLAVCRKHAIFFRRGLSPRHAGRDRAPPRSTRI